ncbi:MAG TPA: FixH family protein [Leadbetterella sp.]|nr:FixH family protein [Leadbetterella sp.]
MNWGHKIGLAYAGFVVFMLTLVILCIKQKDIFLVTENYYSDELAYETRIQKVKNANTLGQGLQILVKDEVDSVYIDLTPKSVGSTGTVVFYRPSDQKMDYRIPMNVDYKGQQKIYTGKLATGLWTVKLEWEKAGQEFYKEEKIQL